MPESASPDDFLLRVLGGKCLAQAVSTAAAWGLADRLATAARTAESLADEVGCPPAAMAAVLRLCAGMGFFASPEPGTFALTERGRSLLRERLGALAAFVGSAEQWDPWSRLRETRAGGETPFELAHGRGLYEFLARQPAAAAGYDAAIDAFTRHEAHALLGAFDFANVRCVVDVGGGCGALLAAVLDASPHVRGVLCDLPHVADRARPALVQRFGARVHVVGGDFFTAVPRDGDVCLVKHVLHNWDDERAIALLQGCAQALAAGGRILAIETILSPDNRADLAAMMDLEMQVLLGGRVRRKPELRRLFQAAGLVVDQFAELVAGSWLLVARRA